MPHVAISLWASAVLLLAARLEGAQLDAGAGGARGGRLVVEAASAAALHVELDNAKHCRELRPRVGADDVTLADLKTGCGDICKVTHTQRASDAIASDVLRLAPLRKQVDCAALMGNVHSDAPASVWPPPSSLPANMKADFSMHGAAKINRCFHRQRYGGNAKRVLQWNKSLIDHDIAAAARGELQGTYGRRDTRAVQELLQRHADEVKGKRLAVLGSEQPWLEALLLQLGAKHVTTIEYGEIQSNDPRIATLTPAQVREKFIKSNGREPRFDGVATYSSIEHAGLGRYGDALNPWGDLQAVAKLWCVTEPNGFLMLGVPQGREDKIHYNAHRVYGPLRYPHLVANWLLQDKEGALLDYGEEQTPVFFTRLPLAEAS